MASKAEIGFVGIGEMGSRMATRLLNAGHPVGVFDADRAKQVEFARTRQCRSAASLEELGRHADVVITMLPNGHVVRSVFLEAEGGVLARTLKPGALVIDTSSSDPDGTRALGAILAKSGVKLVDAPVSGGIMGAESGNLVFMIGGDEPEAIKRAKDVLSILGHKLFEVGKSGAGHTMKVLNNYVGGTGYLAGLEALLIGDRLGLDPWVMVDVLNESTGRNFATTTTLKQEMLSRAFATKFTIGLLTKDVRIATDLAEDNRINVPLMQTVLDLFTRSRDLVGPNGDHTEAVKYWEKLNGFTIGDRTKK